MASASNNTGKTSPRRWLLSLATVAALVVCSCESYPHDQDGTYREVVRSGQLHVGIVHAPPWVSIENGDVDGIEIELVEELANQLDVEIRWHRLGWPTLLDALEHHELDLAAAGFTRRSAGDAVIGFSRTYVTYQRTDHVLAVPPSEHRWLMYIDRFLDGRSQKIRRQLHDSAQGESDAARP